MATDDKISGMIFPADDKAKVSSNDSQTGFLASKLVAGANVTITENNNGANETLTISALGGVTGFTGSVNTAAPNNTVNASRLLVDVPTTNGDLVLQPKGTGAITAQLADASTAGGNKRGSQSIDLSLQRTSASQVASGTLSSIIGGDRNTASGVNSTVIGGTLNTASGQNSTAVGGAWNTAAATNSFVIGSSNTITANGQFSFVWGGDTTVPPANSCDGSYSMVGGRYCSSTFQYTITTGHYAVAPSIAVRTHAPGRFSTAGDCQHEQYILGGITTDAVVREIGADLSGIPTNTATRLNILTNATYAYQGLVTARRESTANESAAWKIEGIIQNSGGTTAFVGTPTVTLLGASAGASTWAIAVTANDTNDNLRIDVTGETGKTIRWGAYVNLMKVAG